MIYANGNHLERKTLDTEEEKTLEYLKENKPEWVTPYLNYLEVGRKGILHRLVQSMIRENIAGLSERSVCNQRDHQLHIHLTDHKRLMIPIGNRYSFGRFDVAGEVMLKERANEQIICHPVELLDLLKQEGIIQDDESEIRFQRFRMELQNSTANYALAYAGMERRKHRLLNSSLAIGEYNTLEWLAKYKKIDERFDPLVFFEQWIVDGHPVHPGAKLRMGFTVEDVLQYSPEFGNELQPVVLAVLKSESRESSLETSSQNIMEEDYPGISDIASQYLLENGLNMEDYRLIPVHPWQYEKVIQVMYQEAIAQKHIVRLPKVAMEMAILMSVRTLAPIQKRTERRHHQKTAVAIQTTGTMRTISAASAHNGAIVSSILKDILEREKHFGDRFYIVEEKLGVWYEPSDDTLDEQTRLNLNRNLVTIFRENLGKEIQEEELAIPASALLAISPISDKPLVAELIDEYSNRHHIETEEEALVAFLRCYAEGSLPGFLTLLSRYGVSLEGHLQNCIPVFVHGAMVRMYSRDFGGVRILNKRLQQQGILRDFHPRSIILTDDEREVRNKLIYPVLQNHFGELLSGMVRWFKVEESLLWKPIIEVCQEVYKELKKDSLIYQQAVADEAFLFGEHVELKAMTTMRLLGEITNYTFSKVPNALHV